MKVVLSIATSPLRGSNLLTAICTPQDQVERVQFYIDGVAKGTADTSAPFTYLWDTNTVPDGPHMVMADCFWGHNRKESVKQQVTVQNVTQPPPPPPPPQAPPVNSTPPTISGTATEGQTLMVLPGTWTNSPNRYTYQWVRCDGSGANCVVIPAATSQSYVLVAADVGATIRCSVVASNDAGPSPAVQTAQTAVVGALSPAVPVNTALPLLSGTPSRGSTLTVTNGVWTNQPTSYTYQWVRELIIGANEVGQYLDSGRANILSAQSAVLGSNATIQSLSIYVDTPSGQLRLGIYDDAGGKPGALKAATPEFTPVAGWNTVNVVTPVALTSGTYWLAYLSNSGQCVFRSGAYTSDTTRYYSFPYGALPSTFSTSPSSDPQHFSYFAAMAGTANISGATSASYVLQTADVGYRVRCSVKALNGAGTSAAAVSAATAVVTDQSQPPPPPPPPPGGTTPIAPQPPITYVSNVPIGLNIANDPQAEWHDYDISLTGDSGVIMGPIPGNVATALRRFRMRRIGEGPGQPGYPVHAIYCKRPNTTIEDFDVEMYRGDGITIRRSGIVVNRFRTISTVDFSMSYFEEDLVAGLVTITNGYGQAPLGYGMWVGLNPDEVPGPVIQRFYFENVNFVVGGSNPKFLGCSPGDYAGAGVTVKNCKLNGAPVGLAHFTDIGPVTIL